MIEPTGSLFVLLAGVFMFGYLAGRLHGDRK